MISQFIDSISNAFASEWHLLVDGGSIDHGMAYYCLVLNLHADPFRKKVAEFLVHKNCLNVISSIICCH